MLEKEIEKYLRKSIKQLGYGAKCLKFESPGFSGVPDRIILLPGAKVIFVETKKPKKTERVRQEYVQKLLRNLGFEVYSSVDSLECVDRITERCKEVLRDAGVYTT
ncbi:MAG: VRR-NUC domain-containing protein [Ruminococcus flavefaciens]|nr:VRR-NUC domain-containing protein [Ruminococcus flavefaciens]